MSGAGPRALHQSHATVEDSHVLDLADLRRRRLLRLGTMTHGTTRWTLAGEELAAVAWLVQIPNLERAELAVSYCVLRGASEPQRINESFPLVTTRPNFGGLRWWFECACGCRCAKLYLAPAATRFRCRVCHNLSYESQRESAPHRCLRQANKIWARLERQDGTPGRPRGMRRRTYQRLLSKIHDLEIQAFGPILRQYR
jgi:hypothetical protein